METENIITELKSIAHQHLAGGMEFDKIKDKLLQRCADEELVLLIISQVKTEYYLTRRKEGTKILCAGLLMILAGFVITCFNYHANQSINFAMYGLTSIGILIVMWGLYKIMG